MAEPAASTTTRALNRTIGISLQRINAGLARSVPVGAAPRSCVMLLSGGGAGEMKISILDDYHNTVQSLACFKKVSGHEVTVWHDHVQDTDALAERLQDTEAL